jgi:hypothetical protein
VATAPLFVPPEPLPLAAPLLPPDPPDPLLVFEPLLPPDPLLVPDPVLDEPPLELVPEFHKFPGVEDPQPPA